MTSILHYESYDSLVEFKTWVQGNSEEINILVTNVKSALGVPTIPLGTTQEWTITGLPRGKDTFEFLANI